VDYRTILGRIYRPAAYYARVRTMIRLLDRPTFDRSASSDLPLRRLFGIPLRDLVQLGRLLRRIAARQPAALWYFLSVLQECARKNPSALECVGILAAFYVHLGPFSRYVMSVLDRQIAGIDAGKWQPPAVMAASTVEPQARRVGRHAALPRKVPVISV
jgi:hypothetical protein